MIYNFPIRVSLVNEFLLKWHDIIDSDHPRFAPDVELYQIHFIVVMLPAVSFVIKPPALDHVDNNLWIYIERQLNGCMKVGVLDMILILGEF